MNSPVQISVRRVLRHAARRPLTTQEAERVFRLFTPAMRDPADQALRARRALRRLERQALLRRTAQGWTATDQGRASLEAAAPADRITAETVGLFSITETEVGA